MEPIKVWRGRTTTLQVSLSYDVSSDIIKSQIRQGRNPQSTLITEWNVSYKTDGTDGELIFTIDDAVSTGIADNYGYMDIMRITDNEPVSVFDDPFPVVFKDVVTIQTPP